MEIMDCFCGVGSWATRDRILPWSEKEILAQLDRFGIGQALVYNNRIKFGGGSFDGNFDLAGRIQQHPRLIPAFAIAPLSHTSQPNIDECFRQMRDAGVRGLWLNAPFSPYRLVKSHATWLIGDWLAHCVQARLPVFFHLEDMSPDIINDLCGEYPDLRVIITGVMYNGDSYLYPLLRRHANLRVCLGHMYIPSGNPERFLAHFPADRLVFGSGLPEFSPGGMISHIMYAEISESDKAMILGGTIQMLMDEVRL